MSRQNDDIEQLKASVSCALVLERLQPDWRLDAAQSTRRNLKFRRGPGKILIVNHDGRGWWDPLSAAKGDVFSLAQYLDPSLDFPASYRVLSELVGLTPTLPSMLPVKRLALSPIPIACRWERRSHLSCGSSSWRYLIDTRGLPALILRSASVADVVREGPRGSAWFAHRDAAGRLTGIEMRGPDWRKFSAGGEKTLFRLSVGVAVPPRVVVCESAIDALSLAALEGPRPDTLYTATAGGMGPATMAALHHILAALAGERSATIVAATDADGAGRHHAARLEELAVKARVRFAEILPSGGLNDWNDAIRSLSRGADSRGRHEMTMLPKAKFHSGTTLRSEVPRRSINAATSI
jgi:hypothetical protein